jgi:homoserine dehydrogenase
VRTRRLLLNGFGHVGQAFANLIVNRRKAIETRYGVDLELTAIANSSSVWQSATASMPIDVILRTIRSGGSFAGCPGVHPAAGGRWAIENVEADVLIEATPTDLSTGEPGAAHIRAALARGLHAVTAAKGPLVFHLRELRTLASERGLQLRIGAATAAALPTIDLAESCLAGTDISRIKGVLNGTSNFILTELAAGQSYDQALRRAQQRGIAEADPTLDVNGHDTAAKLVLIAAWIWDADLRLRDVPTVGIVGVAPSQISAAAKAGSKVKLIGTAWRDPSGVHASVGPETLSIMDPLAHVEGADKGVTFTTDTMGELTVIGGKSDPTGAAAALLRDVLRITGDRA